MIRRIKKKAKNLILKLSGRVNHLKKGVKCNYVWYGNQYGGFYVCPNFLNEKSVVYSFGIGEDISFDKAIIQNHSCEVFGFDPTPKSIKWVKSQNTPAEFRFYDFGISNKSGLIDFYLPKNADFVSGSTINQINIDTEKKVSVKMKTIQEISNELHHERIDILKMDIEGAEYDVIEDILDSNVIIDQILIEFHDRFFENGRLKSNRAVKHLNSRGYEIFAASDSFEEVSFINKNILNGKTHILQ